MFPNDGWSGVPSWCSDNMQVLLPRSCLDMSTRTIDLPCVDVGRPSCVSQQEGSMGSGHVVGFKKNICSLQHK